MWEVSRSRSRRPQRRPRTDAKRFTWSFFWLPLQPPPSFSQGRAIGTEGVRRDELEKPGRSRLQVMTLVGAGDAGKRAEHDGREPNKMLTSRQMQATGGSVIKVIPGKRNQHPSGREERIHSASDGLPRLPELARSLHQPCVDVRCTGQLTEPVRSTVSLEWHEGRHDSSHEVKPLFTGSQPLSQWVDWRTPRRLLPLRLSPSLIGQV